MKIEYLVEKDETGTYCASVPALPGCFTDGRTLAELAANVREAVQAILESYAMLPPGADPADHVAETMTPGAFVRSLSIDFARPSARRSRRRPRRAVAPVA